MHFTEKKKLGKMGKELRSNIHKIIRYDLRPAFQEIRTNRCKRPSISKIMSIILRSDGVEEFIKGNNKCSVDDISTVIKNLHSLGHGVAEISNGKFISGDEELARAYWVIAFKLGMHYLPSMPILKECHILLHLCCKAQHCSDVTDANRYLISSSLGVYETMVRDRSLLENRHDAYSLAPVKRLRGG